ncbi:MAG TPA: N-acetyl-alpha-D-glucosaminyl L-malate synthase BshA [Thermoanaerobaculia bacterium]|nr:N-acetyl-alpha-D-glucosaminyl L-malate synthase BshA [Thermoanaerobaculia bacterium]
MNIGITCYPTFGGSGVVATELGIALARAGDSVHFISYALPSRLNMFHERVHFHEVTVTAYPLFDPYPPYTLALSTKMAEVAAYEKLDVLHVHYAIPHAISAHLARQILHSQRLKMITTLHGTDITLVGRDPSYLPITRFGIEVSDGVTAVSNWLRDQTAKNFGTDKPIDVIPNFVDPQRFQKSRGAMCRNVFASNGERIICHVSNFRPVKRIVDVLEVFLRICRATPSRLLMVGDGPDRSRAEAFCREHGIADRVSFLGNIPNLEEVVAACDLFLLPSEAESFGMAALEAMACEVPVIGTASGGLPEVVVDGKTGYLLPVGDVDAMARRALELFSDPVLHAEMGQAARRLTIERFDVARVVPRYREMYERVLAGEIVGA